jgi:hypothetical protein
VGEAGVPGDSGRERCGELAPVGTGMRDCCGASGRGAPALSLRCADSGRCCVLVGVANVLLLAALEVLLRAMASCGGPAARIGLSYAAGHGTGGLPALPLAEGPLAAGSSCTAGGGVPAGELPLSDRDLRPKPLSAFVSDLLAICSGLPGRCHVLCFHPFPALVAQAEDAAN